MTRLGVLTIGCLAVVTAVPVAVRAPRVSAEHRSLNPAVPRVRESRVAEHALRTFSFFANGEGIHSVPFFWENIERLVTFADVVPGLRSSATRAAERRWGFVAVDGVLEGIDERTHGGASVAVIRCIVCHGGKAAGRFYPGLGNKNFDVAQLGQDSAVWMGTWARMQNLRRKSPEEIKLEQASLDLYRRMGDPALGNLTQGLVPVSLIQTWFYRTAGKPVPAHMPRQQVKVPAFWGYAQKRPLGVFADGFGDGTRAGWAAMVEVTAGQSPSTVTANYPALEAIEEALGDLLPPRYPYAIDERRAQEGSGIFASNCSRCHGSYERDADGLPVYQAPVFVPWNIVRTDPERIADFDPGFKALVDGNTLNQIVRRSALTDGPKGYVAPRLHGIWARFPYLHNGSVPNLRALLTPADGRPAVFLLRDAGEAERFDPDAVGLTIPLPGSAELGRLTVDAVRGARDIYFTGRPGHSNVGHAFGTRLSTREKIALLEFLKTL